MRARGTLILLALTLAIGGYIWFVERGKPTGEARDTALRRVLALPVDSIVGFRLDYGDSALALARTGGSWSVTEPARWVADETAVESLMGYFTTLTAERRIPAAEVEKGATGLDQPWVRVQVRTAGDSTAGHTLAIGYQNPTRSAYYTQVDEESDLALLSASTIDETFRRPLSDFRDRHLVRFDPDRAAAVDLASPERTVSLRRRDGRWWIERPPLAADEAAVRGLLMRIRDLSALEFARDSGAEAPELARPALQISVRGPGDTLLAGLTIGAAFPPPPGTPSGEYEPLHPARAGKDGALAAIPAGELLALALGPQDLRDRHLLDLAGAEIDSLAVRSGERWARAAAADSAWGAVPSGLPEWRVTDFVDDSATGSALAQYGLLPPRIVLLVRLRNGVAREVYLGNESPDTEGVYAHRPGIPGVVIVPRTVRDSIIEGWSRVAQGAVPRSELPPAEPEGSR